MARWFWVLLFSGAWSVAHAGNDDSFFHDNQAALTGGATIGGGTGAGMLWYNPAGLAANDRGRVEVTASAFTLRLRSADDFFSVGGTSQDLSSIGFLTVPTALSIVRRLGEGWYAGIGSYTTRQDTLDEEFFLETSDGDAATYRLASTTVQNNFGLGLGGIVGPFRIGLSAFVVLDNQTLNETVSFIRESDDIDVAAIGLIDENQASMTRLGLELVFGLQWAPVDAFSVGLILRGPRFRLKDDVVVNDTSIDATGGADASADASRGRATTEESVDILSYPLRMGLGFQLQSESGVRVAFDAEYSTALSISLTTWQSQWNLRFGVSYDATENLVIGVGAFTDRFRGRELTPVIGGDFYGGSAGLTSRKRLAIREEGDIVFTTTVVARYAISPNARLRGGALDVSQVNADGTVFFEPGLRSARLQEFSIHLGSGLDF